jgi:hypothetical protein
VEAIPVRRAGPIVVLLMLGGFRPVVAADNPNVPYRGRISELVCQGSTIAMGLKGPHRDDLIVVDDVNDLGKIPSDQRRLVSALVDIWKPLGLVSFGSASYDSELKHVPNVTLRIFIFRDRASCEAWRKQKYEPDGWEQYYSKIADPNYIGYQSREMNKRIAFVNNVWMTCGTIFDCNEPAAIIEHYTGLLHRKTKNNQHADQPSQEPDEDG